MASDLQKEIDELFDELEEYINDDSFQLYVVPLIGDPDNLAEEELENLKKVLKYYKKYGVYLPLPNDPRYENIANYKDYEFTYCIAFEMAIRTDEFYKIKYLNLSIEYMQSVIDPSLDYLGNSEKLELIQNLNLSFDNFSKDIQLILFNNVEPDDLEKNTYKTLTLMLNNLLLQRDKLQQNMHNLGILDLTFFLTQDIIVVDPHHEFKLLYQNKRTPTIDDFENGLNLLVGYYLPKGKLYKKINDDFQFEKILVSKNKSVTIADIQNNIDLYYLKFNSKDIIKLSKDLPTTVLDLPFKKILEKNYKKYQYIDTQPNYTRPALHFINSKIINLPINLNLSKNELIAYVEKIKKDYDEKNAIIQNPIELLGKKLEKAIEPNSIKKMPSGEARKLAFAKALCVYDLYKILTPIFKSQENEFKKENRGRAIDDRDPNSHSKLGLENEIASIVHISNDKVKYYYTLMKEYINDLKYKELITGFKQDISK